MDDTISNADNILNNIPDDWIKLLKDDLLPNILQQIDFKTCTPPPEYIFEFARLTPLNKIKVVILGQDPYPKAGEAHGLAFSSLVSVPKSFSNIYKCLSRSGLVSKAPTTGDLSYWAEQGVLLINCALTTKIGVSNAHAALWSEYTNRLIKQLSALPSEPIFLLWGDYAKKKADLIAGDCLVLTWGHPSPLAKYSDFINCDHFTRVNKELKLKAEDMLDWNFTKQVTEVEKLFDFVTCQDLRTVIFTDGSANPNKLCPEAVAGYAAVFALGIFKDVEIYGNIQNRPIYASNQRAEGMAILATYQYLALHRDKWQSAIIVCDTEFWIKMITMYMPTWVNSDVSFDEKKNPDVTKAIWKLHVELTDGHEIEFRHIRSHNKDNWKAEPTDSYKYFCYLRNKYVDQLAGYARINLSPGTEKIDTVCYS